MSVVCQKLLRCYGNNKRNRLKKISALRQLIFRQKDDYISKNRHLDRLKDDLKDLKDMFT